MEDRVRIYELARQMSISNTDIIMALRELGYDVKSHSSTIDRNVVGNLIAHLGKGKAEAAAAKEKKAPSKAQGKLPPPPPEKAKQVVKPRVLSRYRKEDRIPDETMGDGAPGAAPPHHPSLISSQTTMDGTRSPLYPPTGPSPLPASQISSTPRHPRPHVPPNQERPAPPDIKDEKAVASQAASAALRPGVLTPAEHARADATRTDGARAEATRTESGRGKGANRESIRGAHAVAPPMPPAAQEKVLEEQYEEEAPKSKTGDEWSDESKYAPRAIRNLDKHFQDKQRKEHGGGKPSKKPQRGRLTYEEEEELIEEQEEQEPISEEVEGAVQEEEKEGELDTTGDDGGDASNEAFGKGAVRPMSPSVPIRVAAPSMRATPPRPPKAHRHTHVARHQKKEEEKIKAPLQSGIEIPKVVTIASNLTIQDLAERMHVPATEIIKRLFMKGVMRTVNQMVEADLARELATEMEYDVLTKEVKPQQEDIVTRAERLGLLDEDEGNLITRPPVVTIMGHVDHGKTSLLDAIRQTKFKLTEGEAGGITQKIGAYHVEVEHEGGLRQIVFLDTPGHEAFTAMRARGAKGADVAILVVAADDGVMPQTVEAIDHAKAAGVPIIVAVNKIDKAGADPERVLSQLMERGLLPDIYGGDTVTVNVSAKKQTGLDELLEMILLVADMQDLRANPDRPAQGVIVEAELSRGKGAIATALVQSGTLREGDYIVVGRIGGRVRALFDDCGNRVKAAGPSMPVEVLGLDEVPMAGDTFEVVEDIQGMKSIIEGRCDDARRGHHVTLESLHDMLEAGEVKELKVIIKADVQGMAEAIADSVRKLSDQFVQVRVLRCASGEISENDVNLAASSEAIIIGFNTQPDMNARTVADANGVDIRPYNVIYQITDDLSKAMQGLLEPIKQEVKIGTAEIRQTFKVGKGLAIAGCMVLEGKIQRGAIARIERTGKSVYEGKIDTLKRFKDDVKEVAQGFECGMSFERFSDIQEGDKVHAFIIQEVKRDR